MVPVLFCRKEIHGPATTFHIFHLPSHNLALCCMLTRGRHETARVTPLLLITFRSCSITRMAYDSHLACFSVRIAARTPFGTICRITFDTHAPNAGLKSSGRSFLKTLQTAWNPLTGLSELYSSRSSWLGGERLLRTSGFPLQPWGEGRGKSVYRRKLV